MKGQKMEQQEQEKQEELKSRRNVAAKQGQRTRQKDCEEIQREMRKVEEREKWERYRESVPQGRATAAFTFHLEQERGGGTQLVAAGLSLPSIR